MKNIKIILEPIDFNSIERKTFEILVFETKFQKQKFCSKIQISANELTEIDTTKNFLKQIFNDLRELNVLCQFLKNKNLFKGTVDSHIKEYKSFLLENTEENKSLNLKKFYAKILELNGLIEIEYYSDVFGLKENQKKAIEFLEHLLNYTAHLYIKLNS